MQSTHKTTLQQPPLRGETQTKREDEEREKYSAAEKTPPVALQQPPLRGETQTKREDEEREKYSAAEKTPPVAHKHANT